MTSLPQGLHSSSSRAHSRKRFYKWIGGPWTFLAQPALSYLLPAALCLLLGWLYVTPYGFPAPRIHDEFSYLLGADTFASGRLRNPTHPQWVYFESPHTLHVPSYVSMYHPAQALALAAGQRFAGHPWYGVLASAVLMCLAITWMLRAWLPPRWALLGSLMAVQIALCGPFGTWSRGYWVASYWGGAVAATGGAMVLGALGRLRRRLGTRHALVFAAGVAILANSRPYEGLLLTVTAGAVLFGTLWRGRVGGGVMLRKLLLPASLVLIASGALMAYYCWRTTGNPLRPPYQENLRQYMMRRMFIWGENQPKVYRHASLEKVYRTLLREHLSYPVKVLSAAKRIAEFYLGPVLLLPLLLLFRVVRDRRVRPLLLCGAAVLAGILVVEYVHVHYIAPVTAVFIAVVMQCLRHVGTFRPGGFPAGRLAALALMGASLLFNGAQAWALRGWHQSAWPAERERMRQELVRAGGKHLIVVRYSERHDPYDEWVYNAADIDASPVVWAREMADNSPLLKHFAGRRVWLLEADSRPLRLQTYPGAP